MTFPRVLNLPKYPTELRKVQFDFTQDLAASETLSTETCVATVYSGTDASPSALISGSASASGGVVSQNLTSGVAGVIYLVVCTVTTSASRTLVQTTLIAVVPNAP